MQSIVCSCSSAERDWSRWSGHTVSGASRWSTGAAAAPAADAARAIVAATSTAVVRALTIYRHARRPACGAQTLEWRLDAYLSAPGRAARVAPEKRREL